VDESPSRNKVRPSKRQKQQAFTGAWFTLSSLVERPAISTEEFDPGSE
jgi:hypothetical protein